MLTAGCGKVKDAPDASVPDVDADVDGSTSADAAIDAVPAMCMGNGDCDDFDPCTMNVCTPAQVCDYPPGPPPTGSQNFAFTGGTQTFTVPACVTSIRLDAIGAVGGAAT